MRHRSLICLMLVAVLGSPVLAHAAGTSSGGVKTVYVVKMLGEGVTFVRNGDGGVPVLLPTTLQLAGARATASTPLPGGYRMELAYREPCAGANACVAAEFLAQRGHTQPAGRTVALADGIRGGFSGIQCGGSCSPAAIQWREHGVLYTIAATLGVELKPHAALAAVTRAFVAARPGVGRAPRGLAWAGAARPYAPFIRGLRFPHRFREGAGPASGPAPIRLRARWSRTARPDTLQM